MRWVGLVVFALIAFRTAAADDLPADWAFKPMRTPAVPVTSGGAERNPIDGFIRARLQQAGLDFRSAASRPVFLRRLCFDLTGLPPTPHQLRDYLADESPDADERLIDSLLASPAYGERAALFWLDLVRFAETDGFKADDYRPNAWRYRDYVIEAFNQDRSYFRFLTEQLAGDEVAPDSPAAWVATGFLRHYPDEYNAVNLEQRRQEILNDITDTVGQAFLGITLSCARCHIHKFDPIEQTDYYRIQAFFAGYHPVAAPLLEASARKDYEARRADWNARTAGVRAELEALEKPFRDRFTAKRRSRFPEEYAHLLDLPESQRTPLQKQIAAMVAKQIYADDEKAIFAGLKPDEKERWERLKVELKAFGPAPAEPPRAMAMTDVGRDVPSTHNLKRGNWRNPAREIAPGYLSIIHDAEATVTPPAAGNTSGRRTALARWLCDPEHPLTARVMVNRLWQQHFGRGIVSTPEDFGAQGQRPTHPELLDWLARELIRRDGSLKQLHRLIVTSRTYRQESSVTPELLQRDPDNLLFSRMNRRRLDGEAIRDSILTLGGSLNPRMGGVSVQPELPAEVKPSGWSVTREESERNRRSIYVLVKRNLRYPIFSAFDAPDRNETCAARYVTTTAPQALLLLNDPLILQSSRRFAERVQVGSASRDAALERAFSEALGRLPDSRERAAFREYLRHATLEDACHAVINLNEFVFID